MERKRKKVGKYKTNFMKSKLKAEVSLYFSFAIFQEECMAIKRKVCRKLYRNKSEAEKIIKDPLSMT
jgi:hypothetical protein